MSSSQSLGGATRCGRVIGPSLDKIIKNAAWRKHTFLVSACKSVLDKLESLSDSPDPSSPLSGLSSSDADSVLQPLLVSLDTSYPKVLEPALDCSFKLFSLSLLRGEIHSSNPDSLLFKLIHSVCKVCSIGDESIELSVLRVLLAAVRSSSVLIRGDCLLNLVRTCYNVYLGGFSGTNQICAKSVLAQIMLIVFARSEANSLDVSVKTVSVNDLLAITDKNVNEGNSVHICQGFINDVMSAGEAAPPPPDFRLVLHDSAPEPPDDEDPSAMPVESRSGTSPEDGATSKIREDGFLLFKNLCKLSMKFSSQENTDDQILVRGKTLSLELLKVIIDNGGPIWRSDERFLNAIKQYLCLSLLKNSALSVMSIFQLQCAIFASLLTKFRSGLKSEIGIFFPMLILRVLENVLQPSFLQKMTVLNVLNNISTDPQLIVDIFVNFDCDVESPNIFERIVNGLLKTALGPPPGSSTTLSPVQDITFRHESVKCLVSIVKVMGTWMDQQLSMGESLLPKSAENEASADSHSNANGDEGATVDHDFHPDLMSESSDASTLEQRRAYKIELQKGISLFNRKPAKGIEFLISSKKVGSSPGEIAFFLRNTAGLNATMIGDYLGEREELPMKVMHAYVDSFDFKGMGFGEAIRFFLRGFRLPGEAQKIDRIMEKFAERFCKCDPNSFSSADTAYVLAYSVIMLNTDAHNSMVKEKMTKADFIRNNRGIDDGKDLPVEYLGVLYDHIVKNEIKMSSDSIAPQSRQANSLNKLLGLDGILNLVSWKQTEEKAVGANGLLIKHIQEQFTSKSGKSESAYHAVTDVAILRFMVEASWGPMLAAFSVTLDQSDDRLATAECLRGFRYAVHVTAVMGMQTQRDAFVTSMAKFTNLHCAADMKQKNVDAVKAIIAIAIEDGNHLQDAWEHILTCLSRIEHLQLLGEGAPSDATYLATSNAESEEKKALGFPNLKKKGALQNPVVMAVVRGGSYDSSTIGPNALALVTQEQITNFIANLNLLDQIGSFQLNHVYAHSQRLNSEAIVAFVKALCKVSMSELQSPTDPRVFSLTKLVEIAHYNMNRIRLVWSRMWSILSDFFVSVGLSENLSVAIFVMDSLRQLSMKFLEREELANYNFQNEFLRPFVIVIQKSSSAEIRELIVRCISQMVLSRVSNVKSGWKSVFKVFTTAAADERKNIVLLAFETMEKIVREYFSYITETETTTFTHCVKCLITFTNSRFTSDVSLNAIAFLRFCALKLADGGLIWNEKSRLSGSSTPVTDDSIKSFTDADENISYWVPLLTGLSKVTSDPRSTIRKSSLEVLFDILKDHGHLFSRTFWIGVFSSVIYPIFNSTWGKNDMLSKDEHDSLSALSPHSEGVPWDAETSALAAQSLVDIFVRFFNVIRSQLSSVVSLLAGFIRNPVQGPTVAGVAALLRLADELGGSFSEDEWREIFMALKEAASLTLSSFMKILRTIDDIPDEDVLSDQDISNDDDLDEDDLQTMSYVVSRTKGHIAVQLQVVQVWQLVLLFIVQRLAKF
ncbi:PREDICTED: brefeldin A-inhibited guanine nucleotide-exchange protein 1 isoform X2 [Tarenaya hassleriana]|uniref:brefeldin A-inhibited guanine nucleotide-exchange protein 1 isoform X2 n=1 Tax=Tarenaya hassleriana TaxID=28532 RepID=UPI00053C5DC4|nr:PREDICTED: brefeldin A-inhibited guanine nucleotide-exchange protein 1 isoform X2 [Tarenaya hassleriana]